MSEITHQFVHVLLFECPKCGCPISSAISSQERNPETIDASSVSLNCPCGWSGTLMGTEAKSHVVQTWPKVGEHKDCKKYGESGISRLTFSPLHLSTGTF
jgi:hypothetical protein